jgi:hypothetical protein
MVIARKKLFSLKSSERLGPDIGSSGQRLRRLHR